MSIPSRPSGLQGRARSDAGYSLAEMLVVVLVVAIVCSLVVVAWGNMRSASETLTAARLSNNFLIQARMLSVYRGVNHFVVFDPGARTIAIYEDSGSTASSFDNGDKIVQSTSWPVSVSLAMPPSVSSLTNPLGGSTVTSAWSLPLPDSAARWGSTLRGVMTTPAGVIKSAASTPAAIASGIVVFSDTTGRVCSVGLRGQFGTVKSYRLQGAAWKDLG